MQSQNQGITKPDTRYQQRHNWTHKHTIYKAPRTPNKRTRRQLLTKEASSVLGPVLDLKPLELYLLADPPLTNGLINLLSSRPVFWFVSQTLINELIYLSWALLGDFAISQATTLWLLMCHNLPQDDTIAENVRLQASNNQLGAWNAIVDALALLWMPLVLHLQACCGQCYFPMD